MRVGLDPRIGRPDTPTRNGSRPARRASPATSSGKAPAPHRMAEEASQRPARRPPRSPLLVLSIARNADRPVAALTEKGDDLLDNVLPGERLGDVVEPLLQRPAAALNSIL